MGSTVTNPSVAVPRKSFDEDRKRMAKASLPDLTAHEKRRNYGDILRRTRELARLNSSQVADLLGADVAQISRWESGDENAQTWRYQQHPLLRLPYLRAQAEADRDARVRLRTVIEIEEVA